jgi:pyridoxamine 5'-phosphate oxidase|eukprot:COSAG02_NODE_485_length_21365_cov_9.452584_4_plen_300_part_00
MAGDRRERGGNAAAFETGVWWTGIVFAALGAGAVTGWLLGPQFFWIGAVLVWLLAGNWLARARQVMLKLADLRAPAPPARLLAEAMPEDAYGLLRRWMQDAEEQSGYAAARTMCLATYSTADGPTARTVLCQECGEELGGLIVGTNSRSLKSRQVQEEPRVEAVFRWGDRQVRVRGRARLGSTSESDVAWARLGRAQQLGLTLLQQGELCSEARHDAIDKAWHSLASKHGGGGANGATYRATVPRPEHFAALIVRPDSFEYYLGGHPGYVNDRFLYCRRPQSDQERGRGRFELVGRLQA